MSLWCGGISGRAQAPLFRALQGISRPLRTTTRGFLRGTAFNLCSVRCSISDFICIDDWLIISRARFLSRCREATANDPKASKYVDILLSSADYETFVRLMKIMRPIALSKMSMNADGKSSKTKGNPSSTKHGDDSEKLSKTTGGDDAKGSFADRPSLQNNQHASDAKDSDAMSPSAKMASE